MNERPRGRPRTFDRESVLDAALEQFWLRGFDGTSITDLTAAAGCTAPTLYALFGSKEGLFEESVKRYAEKSFVSRIEVMTSGPANRDVLASLLRITVDATTSKNHPQGCLILTGGLVGGTENAAVAKLRHFILEGLTHFLRRAREGGALGPCDVDSLARFYLAVMQGISAQAVDGATKDDLEPLVTSALTAWPV